MRLQIKVYLNQDSFLSGRCLFERFIDTDLSLKIPYDSLQSSLRFMFGQFCVVSFNLM